MSRYQIMYYSKHQLNSTLVKSAFNDYENIDCYTIDDFSNFEYLLQDLKPALVIGSVEEMSELDNFKLVLESDIKFIALTDLSLNGVDTWPLKQNPQEFAKKIDSFLTSH